MLTHGWLIFPPKVENLFKIDQVGPETICLKGFILKTSGCTPTTLLKSGITGQNLAKLLHDVARSSLANFLKSEVQYYNPFWNAKATNKGV